MAGTRANQAGAARTGTSLPILAGILAAAVFVVAAAAVRFQAPVALGLGRGLTDFNSFHIAGSLAAQGHAEGAYDIRTMLDAQQALAGMRSFMPWTYPPPFTLLVEGLSRLPVGFAFALFSGGSFLFYVFVLGRIAGKWLPGALLGVLPAVLLNLRTGQNGFLTAGLIGGFLLLVGNRRPALGGLALGLMVLKPHLALGAAAFAALRKNVVSVAVAAATALAASALATWAYGPAIWVHFQAALGSALGFLAAGYYPLFRMASVYACLHSLGVPSGAAMAAQVATALAALGLLSWSVARGLPFRFQAAATCAATLSISPYCYDYDLALIGVALAFVLPDLVMRASQRELAFLWASLWLACGYGMALTTAIERLIPQSVRGVELESGDDWFSLGAVALLAFYAGCIRILGRRA